MGECNFEKGIDNVRIPSPPVQAENVVEGNNNGPSLPNSTHNSYETFLDSQILSARQKFYQELTRRRRATTRNLMQMNSLVNQNKLDTLWCRALEVPSSEVVKTVHSEGDPSHLISGK